MVMDRIIHCTDRGPPVYPWDHVLSSARWDDTCIAELTHHTLSTNTYIWRIYGCTDSVYNKFFLKIDYENTHVHMHAELDTRIKGDTVCTLYNKKPRNDMNVYIFVTIFRHVFLHVFSHFTKGPGTF